MRLILALILSALLAVPAAARPLSSDEEAALWKSADAYLRAIGRGDAKGIVAALPPRILNVFAGATGVEVKKLEETLVEQTAAVTKGTKFSELAAKRDGVNAEDAVLADGTAVTWVLVPTSFVTESKGKKARNNQPLLAVREADKWYFLRIDGPERQQMATLAYPFLAGMAFPAAAVTPLN
ncbi:MAG: hypothetical protein R3E44_03760 [Paracoccaceae bacterium]